MSDAVVELDADSTKYKINNLSSSGQLFRNSIARNGNIVICPEKFKGKYYTRMQNMDGYIYDSDEDNSTD